MSEQGVSEQGESADDKSVNGGSGEGGIDAPGPEDTTLRSVVEQLESLGFTGQFRAMEGGKLQCLTCRKETASWKHAADEVTRLEGASDPAEQVMVLPIWCGSCDKRGILILPYGPDASPEEADVLLAMDRQPQEPLTHSEYPGATPGVS